MGRLWQDFMSNSDEIIHKWRHYFPVYERHLAPWVDRRVVMLEIGVSKGGSTRMWERFLGPYATIIGIDIDEKCAKFERDGVAIRIGSQSDLGFLQGIVDEFGVPDIVLDDGSHHMADVRATFDFLYPKLTDDAVYLVEDLHTAFLTEYGGSNDTEANFYLYAQQGILHMNREWSREDLPRYEVFDNTRSIHFYDSMVVFEKGRPPVIGTEQVGRRPALANLKRRNFL